jgi:hypothetical protein
MDALTIAALSAAGSAAAESAPAWLPYATTAASAGIGAVGALNSASVAKQTSDYNAKELERAAAEKRADGTRAAAEQNLKNELVLSQQRAAAAKSGAGTSEGEGYLDLVGDTAQRGRYLSDLDISQGQNAAAGLETKAAITRAKGAADAKAYQMQAVGSLVKGAGDMTNTYLKYKPVASSSSSGGYDDLVDFNADDEGWSTEVYKPKKSKLTYG